MVEPTRAPRLLLVTDATRTRHLLLDLAAKAVAGGVDAIYLREFDLPAAALAALVNDLRGAGAVDANEGTACRAPTTCVVMINGDPGATRTPGIGLHLRERDISPAEARPLLGPDVTISKSVHDAAGARRATGADYLLAGHVYVSRSKPGRPPLGVAGFAAIVAAAPCPVLAIGGITPDRVAEVVQVGAHGVAVIGAIAEADDPRAAASALRSALDDALRNTGKESIVNDVSSATSVDTTMGIIVNGKAATIPIGATVHDFLASKMMTDAMAIVERNGTIVPRAEYGSIALQAGDRLEVVHAVGGG